MRAGTVCLLLALLGAVPRPGRAQARPDETTVIDTIAILGNARVATASVLAIAGIPVGKPASYRDIQRAIQALYATGQYEDIRVMQGTVNGREMLQLELLERPLLSGWSVRGVEKLSEGAVRGRIKMIPLRPYDPAAAELARASIDSLYKRKGYYLARVTARPVDQADGTVRVVFDVDEGRRVAISRIVVNGNQRYSADEIAGHMKTGTEGFFWFQKGEYKEADLESDIREGLPDFYGQHGLVDFRVLRDSLVVAEGTGKATLVLDVDEGQQYRVGSFEIVGNRHFPTAQVQAYYPFADTTGGGFLGLGGARSGPVIFDRKRWDDATQNVRNLYYNDGYIYADVRPVLARRIGPDSEPVLDLRWQVAEGTPAIVNKVVIKGNTITHENVIRRSISMVPGDVFRQQALIDSYQRISNLGFFEQPLPPPTYEQANEQGDVNVIFDVRDKRTGNVNFGASLGQGTGVGGFIGLDESNLFGRAKRISFQWQFGQNINDLNVSYTDPSLWGSLTSATLSLHSSRLRYTVADLGRYRTRGGSIQLGFPVLGSRYTRVFPSYTLEQNQLESETLSSFYCRNCILSALGVSLVRDTRVDLPFPTAGVLHQVQLQQAGGVLRGSGDFRRATFEGRWYTPLARLGGGGPLSNPLTVVLALKAQSGFVWGDVGPHFRQLFSLGGTQFGIPLRGYDEFSITPAGFDPNARTFSAGANAFGRSYFQSTAELGLRVSQALYADVFMDAGNLWDRPGQFNPTRLFRGAGIGLSVISPLGPLGLDYAYGFDRTDALGQPKPGWKFHFKLGNFF